MPEKSDETLATTVLEYELPKLVSSVREGWSTSAQALAVVSALFASLESGFITLIKTVTVDSRPIVDTNPVLFKVLLSLAYSAFLFSACATVSSLLMIDFLGGLSYVNRYKAVDQPFRSARDLMQQFGLKGAFTHLYWHCACSIVLAFFCIAMQIAIYVWMKEALAVFVVAVVVLVWGCYPLVVVIVAERNNLHSTM